MRTSLLLLLPVVAACASGRSVSAPSTDAAATTTVARDSGRPRPYPVVESPEFARAVERGTRTRTGVPGPRSWTNYARYRLDARLDPATRRLTGRGTIRYENRSPDTLRFLALHVAANLFAPGTVRNEVVPITGGVALQRVAAQGATLRATTDGSMPEPSYIVEGTVLWIRPPRAVLPGDTTELALEWSYEVPADGAPRTGTDGEIFYVAYWYPQMAVYDDVSRWQSDPYMGNAEFYMGYADYDVSITVPEGWLVAATGTLQNPEAVLSAQSRERLARARRTGDVVHVVAEADRGAGRATARAAAGSGGTLTWRYAATNVRDFAFGTSDQYLWDATHAVTADSAALRAAARGMSAAARADTADIHTFYRPKRVAWAWDRSAEYARHSIEFLSRYLWPYPYPHMTAVDGVVSCSGMEYPMMTCIGGRRDTLLLYSVTVHEFAHMWFPMQVGSDERRYAWQDEGLTRFNQAQAMKEYFKGNYDLETIARDQYLALARRGGENAGGEVPLMRHGDRYPYGSNAYGIASYAKMATNMVALRALLGDSLFLAAYREYGRRWTGRHPQPFDFWNTFEDVSGRDLDWFWRTWWFETWTLDHAIADVRREGGESVVTVEDRGMAPMPARLTITLEGGRTERREVPVETWLGGARRAEVRVPGVVTRVVLDEARRFPDIDRANDAWPRTSAPSAAR